MKITDVKTFVVGNPPPQTGGRYFRFVKLTTDGNVEAIVRSILALAANMRLDVVAEGIEDRATWNRLQDLGCQQGQGFYMSRPVPAAEVFAHVQHIGELRLDREHADDNDRPHLISMGSAGRAESTRI